MNRALSESKKQIIFATSFGSPQPKGYSYLSTYREYPAAAAAVIGVLIIDGNTQFIRILFCAISFEIVFMDAESEDFVPT